MSRRPSRRYRTTRVLARARRRTPTPPSSAVEFDVPALAGTGDQSAPLEIDIVDVIASADAVYSLAAALPGKDPGASGPARTYPEVLVIYYVCLAGILGSHRRAAAILAHPGYWRVFIRHAHRRGITLPARPPRRYNCEDARNRALAPSSGDVSDLLARMHDRFTRDARALAKEHGCLDDSRVRSLTRPDRANTVIGDGKVVSSMLSEKAHERRRALGQRIDGSSHHQAGDDRSSQRVHGMKFGHLEVRVDERRNHRFYLDVFPVREKGYGGEAGEAVERLLALRTDETGAHTVCYDGALRGKHLQVLADAGFLVLSPTHATTAKPHPLLEITDCDCGRRHKLFTVDGRVATKTVTDTGDPEYRLCPIRKRYYRIRRQGSYAWYLDVGLPCGKRHRVRINDGGHDQVRSDSQQTYRIERLRQAARTADDDSDDLYRRLYGRREDAESANNIIQRTFHGGRAIAYTIERQYLVMIGHALARNAYADMLWRGREHIEDPPQAA